MIRLRLSGFCQSLGLPSCWVHRRDELSSLFEMGQYLAFDWVAKFAFHSRRLKPSLLVEAKA